MDFFKKLERSNLCYNENQRKAIMTAEGPVLVAAGPGSGKTSVITARAAYLIQKLGINPDSLLIITFTRAAANEMKQRFRNFPGITDEQSRKVDFGTFHSIFYKIVCTYYGRYLPVLDPSKAFGIIKNILRSVNEPYDDDIIQGILTDISLARTIFQSNEEFKSQYLSNSKFMTVLNSYDKQKRLLKSIDFDDMMIMCKNILETNDNILLNYRKKYKYLMIDEFQDTCRMQFEIVKLLGFPQNNICVVGDDDQAIYGFRGTMPDCLINFEKSYKDCKSIVLDINYRSTEEIVAFSKMIISHNTERKEKNLKAFSGSGEGPFLISPPDEEVEADFITDYIEKMKKDGMPYSSFAVLFRTNIQSRPVIDQMIKRKIPFNVRDSLNNFYDHWICRDITSYLKLSIDNDDKTSLIRIINRPVRYIPREAVNNALSRYGQVDTGIEGLFENCGLKDFQLKKVYELSKNLRSIKKMRPAFCVNFIRKTIGYDDYVRNRCIEQNINSDELMGILDEYEISSSNFSTLPEFLSHIDEVSHKIKNGGGHFKFGDDSVTLTTIHGAKGLEFPCVFIVGCIEGFMPHTKCLKTGEDIQEERRLFYVAVTRAKTKVFISSPVKHHGKRTQVSRFLNELSIKGSSKPNIDNYSNRFRLGELISHKIFGTGKIIELNNNSFVIQFNNRTGRKTLDIDTCINNRLIDE